MSHVTGKCTLFTLSQTTPKGLWDATMTGLSANTRYTYTVGGNATAGGAFTNQPDRSRVYAVYGAFNEHWARRVRGVGRHLPACYDVACNTPVNDAARAGDFGDANDVSITQLKTEVAEGAFDMVLHVGDMVSCPGIMRAR